MKEKEYIIDYISNKPSNMLFVYGQKSTGKTTLLMEVFKELVHKIYAIDYRNLRRVLITDFKSFTDVLFP